MGRRAHVFVVSTVSLGCLLNTGCFIFGGGGKKKAAMKAAREQKAAQIVAAAAAERAARTRGATSPGSAAAALPPRESAVEWPKPDAFALGDPSAPRTPRTPRREAFADAPPGGNPGAQPPSASSPLSSSAVRVEPEPQPSGSDTPAIFRDPAFTEGTPAPAPAPPTAVAVVPVPPAPAAAASESAGGAAVANKPLEVSDDGGNGSAGPAATSGAANVVQPRGVPQVSVAAAPPDAAPPAGGGDLAKRVTQRLRDNPGDLAAHLDHQVLRFLMDEPVPDLDAISSLPSEDRELLTAIMDGLSNFRSNLRADQNMLLSKKVRPLLDFASRLRGQAELSIPTIALCPRVNTFGNYEPMDGRFVAMQANKTIVYCEVANFASQQNDQGWWETRLSQEAVLYTEDGQKVWSSARLPAVDRSRNRRQDFYIAQLITLPANLTIDRYILKVTVMDEQVKRVAEATIPIQIVASLGPQQQPTPAQQQQQQPAAAAAAPVAPKPQADVSTGAQQAQGQASREAQVVGTK